MRRNIVTTNIQRDIFLTDPNKYMPECAKKEIFKEISYISYIYNIFSTNI